MIFAIDPSNLHSAYVLVDDELKIIDCGKVDNDEFVDICSVIADTNEHLEVAIEMIAHYGKGMSVGKEVFDTCVFIGRIYQIFQDKGITPTMIYRKEVVLNLCGCVRAKDSNVAQALRDRFGVKGTIKNKGWFYGVKSDVWQSYAVAVTYSDKRELKV